MGEDDDELQDVRNSQSPDGGRDGRDRRNGSRSGKPRSGRNRQPRETDYFIRYTYTRMPILLSVEAV